MSFGAPRTASAPPSTHPAIVGEAVVALDTLADLRLADQRTAKTVIMRGRDAVGDGGGGTFRWFPTWSGVDDAAVRVKAATGLQDGGWLRLSSAWVNHVKWFGAKGDGVTIDTTAIQAALTSNGTYGQTTEFDSGLYLVDAPLLAGGVGNPVNGPVMRGAVRVGPNSVGAIVVPNPDVPTAGGAMLKYVGDSGDSAMLVIRNADSGSVENIGFWANDLANACVKMTHDAADVRPIYNWSFSGCAFFDAREVNFDIVGTGAGFGDASGLTFINPVFWGSYNAQTIAHLRCSSQYTLGITMVNPYMRASDIGGDAWYPTHGCSMTGGTVTMTGGGAALFTGALFHMRGASGLDFPAFYTNGLEFQGGAGGQFFDCDDTGANPANRSSVITGGLMDSILSPFSTVLGTWNVGGQAVLELNAPNVYGDIDVASALATVVSHGTVMYQYHAGVGPSGGGRAASFINHTERVYGNWIERRQDGAGGADVTHVLGSIYATAKALTSASNHVAVDESVADAFSHVMTENTTLDNATHGTVGARWSVTFQQHASSAKSLAFDTDYNFGAAGAPSMIDVAVSGYLEVTCKRIAANVVICTAAVF